MIPSDFRLDFVTCAAELRRRLAAAPVGGPARIQLLTGPRQVGKTTILLGLQAEFGDRTIYAACDGPGAGLPGFWERVWADALARAGGEARVVLLLDEIERIPDWAARLKAEWDALKRRHIAVDVVASGSSALRLAGGSKESLAGRFERLTLVHWSARALAASFAIDPQQAVDLLVSQGAYPGAFELRGDPQRWTAYVRDAILEPAVGRDIVAFAQVRRPALLRQVFAVAAASPASIVSLQKLQGQLQDRGALATIAQYLRLLEEAYLVAALTKHSTQETRRRAAPPKLVPLSNAICAAVDPRGVPNRADEPARFGAWVENACLAHAWNQGQRVSYWREEPLEVDGVLDGSWGSWAIEVKTGTFHAADLRGLLEFTRRHPAYRPLLLCDDEQLAAADRVGVPALPWRQFLLDGPPSA